MAMERAFTKYIFKDEREEFDAQEVARSSGRSSGKPQWKKQHPDTLPAGMMFSLGFPEARLGASNSDGPLAVAAQDDPPQDSSEQELGSKGTDVSPESPP